MVCCLSVDRGILICHNVMMASLLLSATRSMIEHINYRRQRHTASDESMAEDRAREEEAEHERHRRGITESL